VLEGSLHREGPQVRVNAQLIRVSDGFHIWSRAWSGGAGDLFRMQQELARQVAAQLGCRPAGGGAQPKDAETYALYLKGQHFRNLATLPDLARSVKLLESATVRDPAFAPAFAALADSHASLAYHQAAPDVATIGRAKAAAAEALRLDPVLAEAHAVLAWIGYFYDWDWTASERGLRRALELNPNSARAHDWLAQRLMAEARFPEALAEARRALALDPLNYRAATNVAVVLYCARRYRDSITQTRQALELNPHFFLAHSIAGASAQELGRLEAARAELRVALTENPAEPDTLAHLSAVERALGHAAEADRLAGQLAPNDDYAVAYLKLLSGDRAGAFAALDRSATRHSSDIPVVAVDPVFAPLAADPRFTALRRRLGLIR
jgi:tetratricopeptide (TPR) repeat protein